LLAKGVNDDAFILDHRGAIETFASKLAPTGTGIDQVQQGCDVLCKLAHPKKKARPKGRALYK